MGWLWSSSPSDSANKPSANPGDTAPITPTESEQRSVGLTDEQRMRIFGKPGIQTSTTPSREEKADAELDAFLQSFSTADASRAAPALVTTPDGEAPPKQPPAPHERILADGSVNIHPAAIYPRQMSCRQAFDQAFYCQSVGGKFNEIYRYGHLNDCSEQWGAFWFCMRTRTLPDRDKEPMIAEYYADRDERRRREVGNSESVWDMREKAVVKAFWRDPHADEEGEE
ncbi:hypothetical protein LTR08_009171 [Meristemomyces frigidus]|nr:hypothetical protein LTR08_009171 [Meristemomyces frigidus]